eukprot:SAG31_NODE_489_length_14938_cov_5.644113_2_plen_90_part_00
MNQDVPGVLFWGDACWCNAVEAFAQGGRRVATTVHCPPLGNSPPSVALVNTGGADVTVAITVSQLARANVSTPPMDRARVDDPSIATLS